MILQITWDVSPEIINIGPLSLRWYGLMFAAGFMLGFWMVRKMFLRYQDTGEWANPSQSFVSEHI